VVLLGATQLVQLGGVKRRGCGRTVLMRGKTGWWGGAGAAAGGVGGATGVWEDGPAAYADEHCCAISSRNRNQEPIARRIEHPFY